MLLVLLKRSFYLRESAFTAVYTNRHCSHTAKKDICLPGYCHVIDEVGKIKGLTCNKLSVMKSECQKMLTGELYDAGGNELMQLRTKARARNIN